MNQQIQGFRIAQYLLVLALALFQFLTSHGFYHWDLMKGFYSVAAVGALVHVIPFFKLELFDTLRLWKRFSFVLDVILISLLLWLSGLNQSLFLFLYLLTILLAGLSLGSAGALWIGALSSVGFSIGYLLSPEVKSISFAFIFILNNLAFYAVALLSGYLSGLVTVYQEKLQAQSLTLDQVQRLNEMIVANIPTGILTIDETGKILTANPSASRVLAIDRVDGLSISDFLPGFWKSEKMKIGQKVEVKFEKSGQETLLGVFFQEQSSLNSSTKSKLSKTFLMTVEDLTEIRRLELAVRQSEKLAAVGQLAAGIAHEIRNPLAGISGSIELMSQNPLSEEDKKLTKIVLREIDRLNRLITEFLDFAKPEQPPIEAVDLGSLVQDCYQQVLMSKEVQGQTVQWNLESPVGYKIRAHSDKLKQAFLNMMINAAQAVAGKSEGQVWIKVWADTGVHLSLRDNGVGMKSETLKRLFEPFHTTKPKGTGLGLAITHKILDSHGARISVKSEAGLGTEFLISFPRV